MALTLYVDTARWRAHHKHVQEQFPGLVPVCKGNGYGFGHERLAEEATAAGLGRAGRRHHLRGRPYQGLLRW
ncbi:hypothetical protein SVIOM342S_07938 [Streptomyces violaceorubidus]